MFGLGRRRPPNVQTRPKVVITDELLPETGMAFKLTRKAIKGVYLRIGRADAQLQVSAPHHIALPLIHRILLEKQDWILQKQTQIKSQRTLQNRSDAISDGSTIRLFDQDHLISVHPNSKRNQTLIDNGTIQVFTRANALSQTQLHEAITQQLRVALQDYLATRLPHWCEKVGVGINFIGIKRMKTRWGSCNIRDKRIWLNLELIHMPAGCIDMVLVHELVHLHERHHNARFYAFMDQFMPDWQRWHTHLKRRGISDV